MSQEHDSIFVAGSGRVYLADVGATPPTDATTPPGAEWADAGFTAKDPGASITPNKSSKDVEAWESFDPVRTIIQARSYTVAIQFLQLDELTLDLALDGIEITGSAPDFKVVPTDEQSVVEKALILEGYDGDDKTVRWYFPRVKVDTSAEIPFKRTDETQLVLTFRALKPSSGTAFELFTHDANFVLSAS